jgi:NDP-hexose-3-ketoreductase
VTGIAVWGIGPHAMKNVLPAIEQARGYELIGVCSRSEPARAEAAQKWGGSAWASPEEMLRSDRVELVYIATPTGLHAAHGMRVLESGRHVVCEKSLASQPEDARALVEFATERKLLLCEALAYQFHPRFLAVRDLVSQSEFGAVLHAFCTFGLPRLEKPGFRMNRELGGGALLDVGCYPLSAMRMLFGDHSSVLHSQIVTLSNDEVDTAGDAAFLFADGLRVDTAWGYNRAYSAALFIWGENQSVYVNRLFSKDTVADSGITRRDHFGGATTIPVPQANAFVAMFGAVREGLGDDAKRRKFLLDAAGQATLLGEVKRCAS